MDVYGAVQVDSGRSKSDDMRTKNLCVPKYSGDFEESELIVSSLDDLVQKLHQEFAIEHVCVERVEHIMRNYKSNPVEWRKYAKFDRYKYTRNLVDEGNGKFNLMLLCWGENQASTIHDHSNAHCFMKILSGSLNEIRFDWPKVEGEPLEEIGRNPLMLNEVAYINDSMGLHRVLNTSHTEKAVSLHLYCPPFNSCHVFDLRTGHRSTCPVTFWSKFGEKTIQPKQ